MISEIDFVINRANLSEVTLHLVQCDKEFVPPLSTGMSISAYAEKIITKAHRFEAWQEATLSGLVAAYCNDFGSRIAYITNVSVIPSCQGMGVATHLMELCIKSMRENFFRQIELQVGKNNIPAIALYKKLGFSTNRKSAAYNMMNLEILGNANEKSAKL